jgi:hypothetical protein
MNKKILIMLSAMILMVYPMAAYAVDQIGNAATPVGYSVNYVVTTDTSFTVTLAGASPQQTAMNFIGARNKPNVEPQGQDRLNTTPRPWATINNTGEVSQDFKLSLNSSNPSTIELLVSNNSDMSQNMTVTNTSSSPVGWTNVTAKGGKAYLYAVANFINTPDNPGSRTIRIASTEHQVLNSIVVSPASASVPEGGTQTYTATGIDQFGNTMSLSGISLTWSSDNAAAGNFVDPTTGVFTAASGASAVGQKANITASSSGITSNKATATIVGNTPVLDRIVVAPSSASVPEGSSQIFTATGIDQYGNPMSGMLFTWYNSNTAAGSIDGTGKFTANASGNGLATTITASYGGKTSNPASVTVTAAVPIVTTIDIAPTTPGINLATGTTTQQFTATVKDQNGNTMSGIVVTWHAADISGTNVGSIDSSSGSYTAYNVGTSDVTATYNSVTSNHATVTVIDQ